MYFGSGRLGEWWLDQTGSPDARSRTVMSHAEHDHVRDAGRLVLSFDLEDECQHGLAGAVGSVLYRLDLGDVEPNTLAHHHGGQEPHRVEAVVQHGDEAVELGDGGQEARAERQGQEPVGDGTAEGRLGRCALDVDVDPLLVAGDVREVVHHLLGDLHPVAGTERLSDQLLQSGYAGYDCGSHELGLLSL